MDSDALRTWQLISELADQLNNNKRIVSQLQEQTNALKVRRSLANDG